MKLLDFHHQVKQAIMLTVALHIQVILAMCSNLAHKKVQCIIIGLNKVQWEHIKITTTPGMSSVKRNIRVPSNARCHSS